jgi:hypothetical protein
MVRNIDVDVENPSAKHHLAHMLYSITRCLHIFLRVLSLLSLDLSSLLHVVAISHCNYLTLYPNYSGVDDINGRKGNRRNGSSGGMPRGA